ncbi:glycosyltransferase family 2 protein [Paenibacillus sp. S28]|uniref:glycosyltransferase family 2 protein n=1 Tax=Paenibacillus sp. S28 TaxID=2767463 RepID=UPI00190D2AB1|nr:glycosyltransferase family 2 protein [Paenibacillus sp. S28]MBJ9993540.1 glycosyltransferase family 2 protein [Paenibacillus sp. S28]
MISISLCMIVKNEEETLGRCLKSVQNIVDEIIIVDTGSTDNTKEIALQYTDQIYDFEWIDDFAAARNYAFSCANKDYIFWLDADDLLKDDDSRKLMDLKGILDPAVDSVTMDYHLAFDEFGNVTSSVRRNRLVKRENKFQWIGAVHEYLEVWGNILNSDVAVTHSSLHHDSDRNLSIYEKRLLRGEVFSPRDLYYFANELVDHQMYEQAICYYEKFLATEKGWIEDNISSCGKLADCYHELGDREKELESSLRSFRYSSPRPEFCCRIGYHFLQQDDIRTAIFWYKLATQHELPGDNLGFFNHACSTWLPHLQLCVCYDRIGEYRLAYNHNEIARSYRPTDPKVIQNKRYLESVLGKFEGVKVGGGDFHE